MSANIAEAEDASLLAPEKEEVEGHSHFHRSLDRILLLGTEKFLGGNAESRAQILAVLAILQWWTLNVLIVLLNKYIFQVYKFTFPLTLTTIHFTISWLGAFLYIHVSIFITTENL
jgi:hypothetical protein